LVEFSEKSQMKRFRFRISSLLWLVAIVAALLTAFEAGRRWERAKNPLARYTIYQPFKGSVIKSLKHPGIAPAPGLMKP
jgi:hypothetical protein